MSKLYHTLLKKSRDFFLNLLDYFNIPCAKTDFSHEYTGEYSIDMFDNPPDMSIRLPTYVANLIR